MIVKGICGHAVLNGSRLTEKTRQFIESALCPMCQADEDDKAYAAETDAIVNGTECLETDDNGIDYGGDDWHALQHIRSYLQAWLCTQDRTAQD